MTSSPLLSHIISLAHGLAASLLFLGVLYFAGSQLTPRRFEHGSGWADRIVVGLVFFLVLCWIGVTSRSIPVFYVTLAFGAILSVLASVRSQGGLTRQVPVSVRQWLIDFSVLYVVVYLLIRPAAGSGFLPLAPDGNLDLVTYARYAKHLLRFGAAELEITPFAYTRSPASAYVLAGDSLFFGRDPLNAAMPALFMLVSLFGMIAAHAARLVFGFSRPVAMALATVVLCGPLSRWLLMSYGLAEVMAATAIVYLLSVTGEFAVRQRNAGSLVLSGVVGLMLLFVAAPPSAGWAANIPGGFADLLSRMSPAALLGSPISTPAASEMTDRIGSAAALTLALTPLLWAGALHLASRFNVLDRLKASESDQQLARSLVVYVGIVFIAGNVAVQAVRAPGAIRRSDVWRQLDGISALSFRSMTLKVTEEANGLSTALAMYYLPGRKAEVFGRGVSPQDLSFESVSKEQPMFIQNFGCEGVGHADTVSLPRVGCVLMAPPSLALGASYPFNQTFLFITYDRMTPREAGGRWNTRPTLQLRVMADPQRVPLDRNLFINLLVEPFLAEGAKPRQLLVTWGDARHGEQLIGGRKWFSLNVQSADWQGNRLWALPITIGLPDGRALLFQEVALTDTPKGEVVVQAAAPPAR